MLKSKEVLEYLYIYRCDSYLKYSFYLDISYMIINILMLGKRRDVFFGKW